MVNEQKIPCINNIRLLFLAILFCCSYSLLLAKDKQPSVAVVTDIATYSNIGQVVDKYVSSILQSGKNAFLIQDIWQHPDSIREKLKKLYITENLEGAVFIGDIPIPMIRDAQHLATAFKMDQARYWKSSSIPSDRFYDDFDLIFEYIKQDEDETLYHYYSLKAESGQYVSSDIYSARIRPPLIPGKDKYRLTADYLKKAVAEKEQQRTLTHVLHFAGHGYNSESMSARLDESWVLKRHFPFLGARKGARLDFINYDRDDFVKARLLNALSQPNLDIAILHHHGTEDMQLLSQTPSTSNPQQYIEYTKRFFRSKIRDSKDTVASKKYYIENYNVPENWVEGAFDKDISKADSVFSASMDINIPDTYEREFNVRFIMFDACFNGSFHLDDYIGGHYIFNPGKTIIAKANTVNTLQDIWPNELIGILDYGVCVGNWAKEIFTLESHLLGDPTYCFANSHGNISLDRDMTNKKNNPKFWRKILVETDIPDLKALSLVMLQKNNAISSEELLKIQENDPDPIVRMEAFSLLKKRLSPQLPLAIGYAMTDSYELLRRLGTLTAGKSGDPDLLPVIARVYFNPMTTTREIFQLRFAVEQYPYEMVAETFALYRTNSPLWPDEDNYSSYLKGIKRSSDSKKSDFEKLNNPEERIRSKRFTISAQRNLCQTQHLNSMFEYMRTGDDQDIRLLLAETLGWYVYSHKKTDIIDFCRKQYSIEQNAAVKNELQKTINRLTTY